MLNCINWLDSKILLSKTILFPYNIDHEFSRRDKDNFVRVKLDKGDNDGIELLSHIKSISHPLMISPNDIVLINKDQFYVTNDHGTSSKKKQTLEEYLPK